MSAAEDLLGCTVVEFLAREGISQYTAMMAQPISLADISINLERIADSLGRIADKLDPQ